MRFDLQSLKLFGRRLRARQHHPRGRGREHRALGAQQAHLHTLEDILKTPLFVRSNKGLEPTAAADPLLQHARVLLRDIKQMESELLDHAEGVRGQIRLHASLSTIVQYIANDIRDFLALHPALRIDLQESLSPAVVRAVAENAGRHRRVRGHHRDHRPAGVPVPQRPAGGHHAARPCAQPRRQGEVSRGGRVRPGGAAAGQLPQLAGAARRGRRGPSAQAAHPRSTVSSRCAAWWRRARASGWCPSTMPSASVCIRSAGGRAAGRGHGPCGTGRSACARPSRCPRRYSCSSTCARSDGRIPQP